MVVKLSEDGMYKEAKKQLWELGSRHVAYGAEEAHFEAVGKAFFLTLEGNADELSMKFQI